MNCEHARLLIGADPYSTSPQLEEHLENCPACSEFRAEMVALEGSIRHALERSPPVVKTAAQSSTQSSALHDSKAIHSTAIGVLPRDSATLRVKPMAWRGWALAASVLIAVTATMVVWFARPTDSLAHEIAVHVGGEPLSWDKTTPVDAAYLERVLRNGGVDSTVTSNEVVYAQTCLFRGHFVPHLVVQTASGPVTVMILPNEHVTRRQSFYEGGFAGVIVPVQQGSIAVLARGATNIDDIAGRMRSTMQAPADTK